MQKKQEFLLNKDSKIYPSELASEDRIGVAKLVLRRASSATPNPMASLNLQLGNKRYRVLWRNLKVVATYYVNEGKMGNQGGAMTKRQKVTFPKETKKREFFILVLNMLYLLTGNLFGMAWL